MSKKRRKNPFGDLAHFNPFGARGKSKSLRRNVADEDVRNLQQRADIGDEDAQDRLQRMNARIGERVIKAPRPRRSRNVEPQQEEPKSLWAGIERLMKKPKKTQTAQEPARTRHPVVQRPQNRQLPMIENVCRPREKHRFSDPCFESIKEARAFLEFKVPEMSPEECAANAAKIAKAEQVVGKADRRNKKRQLRRAGVPVPPSRPGTIRPIVAAPAAPKKESVHFEELSGPDGEVHRFKLIYEDGKFKKRVRTKEEPPIGAVILDMTEGAKAWKRYSDKRRGIPLTPEMKRSYENSFLYKVRQFAAGKIDFKQLIDKINSAKKSEKSKRSIFKKLRRKNRKNG